MFQELLMFFSLDYTATRTIGDAPAIREVGQMLRGELNGARCTDLNFALADLASCIRPAWSCLHPAFCIASVFYDIQSTALERKDTFYVIFHSRIVVP